MGNKRQWLYLHWLPPNACYLVGNTTHLELCSLILFEICLKAKKDTILTKNSIHLPGILFYLWRILQEKPSYQKLLRKGFWQTSYNHPHNWIQCPLDYPRTRYWLPATVRAERRFVWNISSALAKILVLMAQMIVPGNLWPWKNFQKN